MTGKTIGRGAAFACVAWAAFSASAVEMVREGDLVTVRNARCAATFDLAKGGSLARLESGGRGQKVFGSFSCGFDAQPAVYNKSAHGGVVTVGQYELTAPAAFEVAEKGADRIVLRFTWPLNEAGKVVQTVRFDESAVIGFEQEIEWSRPLGFVRYVLFSPDSLQKEGRFYPENRSFTGVYSRGEYSKLPRWKHYGDGRFGFGLVATGEGWDHFCFYDRPAIRGKWGQTTEIGLCHEYLANVPVPAKRTVSFALTVTPDPAVAHGMANALLAGQPEVQLCDLTPDRVSCDRGAENGLETTLVNNGDRPRKVRAMTETVWGLGERRTVAEDALELAPGEMRAYAAKWRHAADVEWGVTTVLSLYGEDGALLDRRADVTAVHDDVMKPNCFTIIGLGLSNQDGAEAAWADELRRSFAGAYEYYVWTPATWDPERKAGLSPEADAWEPMTESSGAYRARITKRFLKTLIDEGHRRGVKAIAWITGLCNYQMAYAHPEMFQYCRNGQLAVYNGKVYGDDRFAVAKLAPYTVEAARDWGEQMADSVDMFGWDGCRWDWGFLPCSPNDPVFVPLITECPERLEWFDHRGRSSMDLYFKNEDELGARLVEAWDAAVKKRHPRFANCSNLNATDGLFAHRPKYMKKLTEVSSLALLEYLLNLTVNYPTYAIWSKHVAHDTQNVRANGAQTAVGGMNQLCEGSVGEQLARYACVFSGSKWWGGPWEYRYWGAKRRNSPFAIRFSEYFYSTDFRLVPENRRGEVSVDAGGRKVFWRQFVYERRKDGVREVVVSVINVDPDQYITVRQAEPEPMALKVTCAPHAGERLVSAHALLPGDEPVAVGLGANENAVRLPRMEEAVTFVFRFK